MAIKQIETELAKARQQLADLQAVVQTSEDNIAQLESTLSESLAGIPLDKLDAAALKQADTRLKLESERLKHDELERRVYVAQEKVFRLNAEWRQAKGREMAAEAYKEAEEIAHMLQTVLSRLKAHSQQGRNIRDYYPAYDPCFTGSFVQSLEAQLEAFDREASLRIVS